MAVTAQQLLDAADQAILDLLGGAQSVSVNGQSFTLASLADLRALRKELRAEVADQSDADAGLMPGVSYVRFERPS